LIKLCLVLAAIMAPAALFAAAPSDPSGPLDRTSLIGQFLIATPEMGDPRFRETVILMVRHGPEGAFGLVINRQIGERPLAELLDAIGDKGVAAEGKVPILSGGPVQQEMGFVLHSNEYRTTGTLDVAGGVAFTATADIFRDMAAGKGPRKFLAGARASSKAKCHAKRGSPRQSTRSFCSTRTATACGSRRWSGARGTFSPAMNGRAGHCGNDRRDRYATWSLRPLPLVAVHSERQSTVFGATPSNDRMSQ
jgi:putative transcriptional regulator